MTVRHTDVVVAVVDDDQSILRSLEYLLESADYAVRSFTSAAALLDSNCVHEIDCLISDIDMPGIDGFQLLEQIRAVRPGLPAILITGYPERLTQLPPFGDINPRLFTKPFRAEEFLAAISESLASSPR